MIERETISAHEINKYDYCPYQWYYERLYGRADDNDPIDSRKVNCAGIIE